MGNRYFLVKSAPAADGISWCVATSSEQLVPPHPDSCMSSTRNLPLHHHSLRAERGLNRRVSMEKSAITS